MKLPPRCSRIILVEPLRDFTLRLTFDDGFVREIDLQPWLRGPVFEPICSSQAYFRTVRLEGGTIAWANGADFCPDVLRHEYLWPDFARNASRASPKKRSVKPSALKSPARRIASRTGTVKAANKRTVSKQS